MVFSYVRVFLKLRSTHHAIFPIINRETVSKVPTTREGISTIPHQPSNANLAKQVSHQINEQRENVAETSPQTRDQIDLILQNGEDAMMQEPKSDQNWKTVNEQVSESMKTHQPLSNKLSNHSQMSYQSATQSHNDDVIRDVSKVTANAQFADLRIIHPIIITEDVQDKIGNRNPTISPSRSSASASNTATLEHVLEISHTFEISSMFVQGKSSMKQPGESKTDKPETQTTTESYVINVQILRRIQSRMFNSKILPESVSSLTSDLCKREIEMQETKRDATAKRDALRTTRIGQQNNTEATTTAKQTGKMETQATTAMKRNNARQDSHPHSKELRIFKSLTLILAAYILLWTPVQVCMDIFCFSPCLDIEMAAQYSSALCYFNSAINPFLYAISSAEVKAALKKAFCHNRN